ncbi:MAG TPA: hypothetical protein VN213_05050 [Solirubrobacteraceae bacterium]|nr:hypothetical protein [Solirubrobacteraceae bacterium]
MDQLGPPDPAAWRTATSAVSQADFDGDRVSGFQSSHYLNAAIDCCTREICGWALDVRCRATEAIAVIDHAVAERDVVPGALTLGSASIHRRGGVVPSGGERRMTS